MSNVCSTDKDKRYGHNNNRYIYYERKNLFKEYGLCGIKNYGTNCYLNSGLQIISRCEKFVEYLNENDFSEENCPFYNILKKTINIILKNEYLDPREFMEFFIEKNSDFTPNAQNCSQLFIRTVLSNINNEIKHFSYLEQFVVQNINGYYPKNLEKNYYEKYLNNNKIFPQSLPYSYFSGIIKTESTGKCNKCGEVKKYSFMEFFDMHMYLDTITSPSTDFDNVLKENLGYPINVKSSCPHCKSKIIFEDISKIIKLPEILVFTIERYIGETNRISIKPNEKIEVKDYVEKSMNIKNTTYELFAINIRFGHSNQFGHQICQIKKDNNWYTLDDSRSPENSILDEFKNYSYGLFYKQIKTDKKDIYNNNINNNNQVKNNSSHLEKENKIKVVDDNDLIRDIKIKNNLKINSKLEYNGIILKNEDSFKKYNIKNGDIITYSDFDNFYNNISNANSEFIKNKDRNKIQYICTIEVQKNQKNIINEGKTLEEKKNIKEENLGNKKLNEQEEINKNPQINKKKNVKIK